MIGRDRMISRARRGGVTRVEERITGEVGERRSGDGRRFGGPPRAGAVGGGRWSGVGGRGREGLRRDERAEARRAPPAAGRREATAGPRGLARPPSGTSGPGPAHPRTAVASRFRRAGLRSLEDDPAAQDLLQQVAALVGREELQLDGAGRRPGPRSITMPSASPSASRSTATRWSWLRSSPMAIRRMAEQDPHQVLIVGVEAGELAVAGLGRALAVVPGEEGDDLDLVVGQPGEDLAVADHVVRVQVVAAVGDEQAHVGQQRAGLEVLAGRLPETLQRRARPAGRPDRRTARAPGGRRGRSARARRRTARPGARTLRRDTSRRWWSEPPRVRWMVSSSTPSRRA